MGAYIPAHRLAVEQAKIRNANRASRARAEQAEAFASDPWLPSRAACHEAGHAVAAFILGGTVEFLTIQGRGNIDGLTHYIAPPTRHARLLTLAAGHAAEKLLHGSASPFTSRGDYFSALEIAGPLEIEAAFDDAIDFLCQHRAALETVAYALDKERTITGARLAELLEKRSVGHADGCRCGAINALFRGPYRSSAPGQWTPAEVRAAADRCFR